MEPTKCNHCGSTDIVFKDFGRTASYWVCKTCIKEVTNNKDVKDEISDMYGINGTYTWGLPSGTSTTGQQYFDFNDANSTADSDDD